MSIHKHMRAIGEILKDLGITSGSLEKDARHIKVSVTGPGGTRKVTASASPSDHRAIMNLRMDIRRVAREVGAISA